MFLLDICTNNHDFYTELSISFTVAPSKQPSTLIVRYETNIKEVASDLLSSSASPTEGFDPSGLSTGMGVADGIQQVATAFSFLDSMQPFKEMFDRLAKVRSLPVLLAYP